MGSIASAALLLLFLTAGYTAEKLPPYVTKCPSREPAQFKKCVLENARAAVARLAAQGDKKYGLSSPDPLNFPLIETDNNNFKLKFIDLVIKTDPPRTVTVDDTEIDLDRHRLLFVYSVPALDMISKYQTDGRILVLPIKGEGDAVIHIDNFKATFTGDFDIVKNPKDGLEYIKIKNTHYNATVSKVTFNFSLFNGDKTLSKTTNDFLNENWKDVYDETKWSTFEAVRQLLTRQFQNFFDRVPYKEAFPE